MISKQPRKRPKMNSWILIKVPLVLHFNAEKRHFKVYVERFQAYFSQNYASSLTPTKNCLFFILARPVHLQNMVSVRWRNKNWLKLRWCENSTHEILVQMSFAFSLLNIPFLFCFWNAILNWNSMFDPWIELIHIIFTAFHV